MPRNAPTTPKAAPAASAVVAARLVKHAISHRSAASAALSEHAKRQGDFPVKKVFLYRRDAIVRKAAYEGCIVATPFGGREAGAVISEFSDRSRYRLLFFAKNCNADFRSMMTLTYPKVFETDGKKVKKHLDLIGKRLRREYSDFRAVWFLEFQRRGAPHFHLLCEPDLASMGEPQLRRRNGKRKSSSYWTVLEQEQWLASAWYSVVGSGDEKHLRAGVAWEIIEQDEGALRYAATHAAKPHQKKVPELYQNVGRFWGKIGNLKCEKIGESTVNAEDVFEVYGHNALSSRGRVVKYLFDAADKFTMDEI